MKPLVFLYKCRMMNWLRSLVRQPAQLIVFVVLVVLFLGQVISVSFTPPNVAATRTLHVGGYTVALVLASLFVTVLSVQFTVKEGVNSFRQADVQFLFCSHYRSQRVLMYGLFSYLKLLGLIIFVAGFQVHNLFNVGLSVQQIIQLIACVILVLAIQTILAVYCFALSTYSVAMKRLVLGIVYGLALIMLVIFAQPILSQLNVARFSLEAFDDLLKSQRAYLLVPLYGWMVSLLTSSFIPLHWSTASGIALLFLLTIFALVHLYRMNLDFYELAINTTAKYEKRREKMGAQKGGFMRYKSESYDINRKSIFANAVKVGGLKHGWGVSAFFFRQWVELRRSRPFLIGFNTVVLTLVGVGVGFFGIHETPDWLMMSIFCLVVFYDFMFVMTTNRFAVALKDDFFRYAPGSTLGKLSVTMAETGISRCIDFMPGFLILVIWHQVHLNLSLMIFLVLLSIITLVMAIQLITMVILDGLSDGLLYQLLRQLITLILSVPSVGVLILGLIIGKPMLGLALGLGINICLTILIYPLGKRLLNRPKQ